MRKTVKKPGLELYLSCNYDVGIETRNKNLKLLKDFPARAGKLKIKYLGAQKIVVAPGRLLETLPFLRYAHDQGKWIEVTVKKGLPLCLRIVSTDTQLLLAPIEDGAAKEAEAEK